MNQRYNSDDRNKENLDHPERYLDLPPEVKTALDDWIQLKFEPARRMNRDRTSYGLKHLFQRESGIYIYNGAFKGAMLAAGFMPDDPDDQNWYFKMKDRIPDSFYGWVYKRYCFADSPSGDFARDMKADYRFPIYSIDRAEIEGYLRHQRKACLKAMQAFNRIWKRYERIKLGVTNLYERSAE